MVSVLQDAVLTSRALTGPSKGPFLVYIIMLQKSAFPKKLIPLIVVQQM